MENYNLVIFLSTEKQSDELDWLDGETILVEAENEDHAKLRARLLLAEQLLGNGYSVELPACPCIVDAKKDGMTFEFYGFDAP